MVVLALGFGLMWPVSGAVGYVSAWPISRPAYQHNTGKHVVLYGRLRSDQHSGWTNAEPMMFEVRDLSDLYNSVVLLDSRGVQKN